ncbi:type II secretion system protein [Microbulbifer guangxiensis]|uniref:type II secretion system protein n=1 Tax=Microbulbifer guangxiensis TaxID=2904249 RepID=UPI001F482B16|nr:type II secretion system protein [Microbulbifer guangxiensis]
MNPMPGRHRGFTLIELLVVIVIIAVLAGMAMVSLGGAGARAWSAEVQRLANLLQLVADRALIDKAHYGVVFEEDSYSVVRFDAVTLTWEPLAEAVQGTAAARFASHQLPGDIRLEVLSEAEMPVSTPTEFAADRREDDEPVPQFVSLSSGEVLPAEIGVQLLESGRVLREARLNYSSLHGLELEWGAADD